MGYSRTMSATHKEHISQALKGKKHTEQTKKLISQKIKARWAEVSPQPTQPTEPTKPTQIK
uniref:Nuclease associated modular domain-containing protein n=1 Tax=uncultured prokaryote TaxID=198431 RepID=A0A0H5PVE9_9ZZZZ|nr:hypothetical protein [uncultured prokaryote]